MKLIKDFNGNEINIGDTVKFLTITDNSADATELFGVEPQLGGWVVNVFVEEKIGVVTFDEETLLVVIRVNGGLKYPLSKMIRLENSIQQFEYLENLEDIQKDFGLDDVTPETIVNSIYIIKK